MPRLRSKTKASKAVRDVRTSLPSGASKRTLTPVRESLEQLFVKERETMWINEKQLYQDLAARLPQPETKQQAAVVK